MGLINVLLKLAILVLDMRETYESLNIPRLNELGQMERTVRHSKETEDQKQTTRRRRVGGGKRRTGVRTALTTILVWNIFQKLEPVCDNTLAWFVPFYDSIKTLFLVWLLFTRSFGAAILMTRVIAPIVRPYEGVLSGVLQLASSLEAWTTAMCYGLAHRVMLLVGLSSSTETALVKDESLRITGASGTVPPTKKPPPSGPSLDENTGRGITNGEDRKPRPKAVSKKASSSTLKSAKEQHRPLGVPVAKARKVLQDLPVPSHQPTEPLTNGHRMATPLLPSARSPQDSVTLAKLGPPPSSPGLLKNFAFIPGQTPPQARPSIVSPTPQFPGGFGASASNPYQPARIPVTSSMPPLTASRSPTQQARAVPISRPLPAHDDNQVVPPPTIYSKASSTTVRRRKANGGAESGKNASSDARALVEETSSTGKKRTRDEAADSTSIPEARAHSPVRKRPKADALTLSKPTSRSSAASKQIAKRGLSTSTQRSSQPKKTASSINKVSNTSTKEPQSESSPPKTRLTRSRTKQNLVE